MRGRPVAAGAANRQSHPQYARSTRGGNRSRHATGGTKAQRWLRLLRHVLVQSVLLGDSEAAQTSTEKHRAIARSAIWTSRTRSIPIVQITLATDQTETPSRLGRYTFTAPLDYRGRAGAKRGSPRRTRKRSGNSCATSSVCLRRTPTRATTSIRARRTSRPARSCLNGVMRGSFQRWKRLLGARKRSAVAPTSRRP